MQSLIDKFKQVCFDPKIHSIDNIPDKSGNYIVCLRKKSKLPQSQIKPIMTQFEELEVIYTGISSKSLRYRDYHQHFNGHAGRSTLRKSLGVLFGYKQVPRDKNPNTGKTKFNDEDEQSLSKWMHNNLVMYVLPNTNFGNNEVLLIHHFNPPFNLKKNSNIVNLAYRKYISSLRTNK